MQTKTITHDDLEVDLVRLSDHEWRVSDHRAEECDGRGIIGFIELIGDCFEVTLLDDPTRRSYHAGLDACLAHIRRGAP